MGEGKGEGDVRALHPGAQLHRLSVSVIEKQTASEDCQSVWRHDGSLGMGTETAAPERARTRFR